MPEWIVMVPFGASIVLADVYRRKAIEHRSALGQQHYWRVWWLRWAAGRRYFTEDGWRYLMRALWLPLAGAGSSVLTWAAFFR